MDVTRKQVEDSRAAARKAMIGNPALLAEMERGWARRDAADARRAAAADNDPLMLIGPDIIRYAEALMRDDHRVLAPDFQFWGGVADQLNDIASLPDRPGAQTPNWATRFNLAVTTAVGYIRMSKASAETKARLLRDFPPPPEPQKVPR